MSIDEAWAKFTTRRKICKYWEISCNNSEAMHYFQQYYSDGYYDGDPNDRLIKEIVKARREAK